MEYNSYKNYYLYILMKTFFHFIGKLTLIWLILFDGIIIGNALWVFATMGIHLDSISEMITHYGFLIGILIYGQIIFWFGLIQTIYINPIRQLRKEIALFLTGAKDESNLSITGLNEDANFITNFFNKSLQILRNFKDEMKAGRVLRSEVELAAEIQRAVLDKEHPPIPSLEFAANAKSATEVGGDSFDFIERWENHYIYLGDVTGHGVASGFVMMMVNALISGFSLKEINSATILANTNTILKPRVKQNMMMTCLMLRWNETEKKLYMAGAWHEYLIVYKANGEILKIKSGWVALWMIKDITKSLQEQQIQLDPDDIIVMYTDGISEARLNSKQDGILFGIDRIIDSIEKTEVRTAQNVFNNITIELSRFMGYNHIQFDDITLIVLRYKRPDEDPKVSEPLHPENITEWSWNTSTVISR